MTSGKRLRNLIYALAVAFIALLAGVFLLFLPKSSLRASANELFENETHTTDALYFTNGASVNVNLESVNKMLFFLNVQSDAFKTADDKLIISFDETLYDGQYGAEFLVTDSISVFTNNASSSIPCLSNRTANAKTDNILTVAYRDIPFNGGETTLKIFIKAPINLPVQLKATCYDGEEEYNTCCSAVRTIDYVWQMVVESGEVNELLDTSAAHLYLNELTEFKRTLNVNEFCMHDEFIITPDKGLRLILNIPTSVQEEINAGVTVTKEWTAFADYLEHHTAKMLVITRAETPDAFTDLSNVLKEGVGYQNFYYGAADLAWLVDGENYQVLPNFYGETVNEFYMPMPGDNEKEYYYYAQVVEVNRTWQKGVLFGFDITLFEHAPVRTVLKATTYFSSSIQAKALEILSMDTSIGVPMAMFLQDLSGTTPASETYTVDVVYKGLKEQDGLTIDRTVSDKTYSFQVKSTFVNSKELVLSSLYEQTPFKNLSKFNVVYNGYYATKETVYKTGSRILLQAKGYEYSYSSETQKGTLTVLYSDFTYSDFALRVRTNDVSSHLIMDCYTAEVSESSSKTTLTFEYAKIQEQMYNTVEWKFTLTPECFSWNTEVTDNYNVEVVADKTSLKVSFPKGKDALLMNLNLVAVATIVENVEYTVRWNYVSLSVNANGDIVETWTEADEIKEMYFDVISTYNWNNFKNWHGELINAALELPNLDITGAYMTANGLMQTDAGDYHAGEYWIEYTITYAYNTVFKIQHTENDVLKTDFLRYVALENDSLLYTGEDILREADIPKGYRVENMTTSTSSFVKFGIDDKIAYKDWTLTATAQDVRRTIPVTIHFTDEWNLVINYFETYKSKVTKNNTPFAEKKSAQKTIKVLDYADVYALKKTDIQDILNLTTLTIGGMVSPYDDGIEVVFDGVSTYTVNLSYGFASVSWMDYDGNIDEIKVPLIPYEDWCDSMGVDWSVMMLNNSQNIYFGEVTDIKRENLYGFFSLAVFEEQVTDFNYYFRNMSGSGSVVLFEAREAKGSALYASFASMRERNPVFNIIGTIGMIFCETFNPDNTVYHYNFFYLDGSVKKAFISNGGADSADDRDTAFENFGQDVGDWFVGLGENSFVKLLGAVVGLALLVVFGFAVYKLLVFLKLVTPPGTSDGEEDGQQGKNKDKGKKDNKNGK